MRRTIPPRPQSLREALAPPLTPPPITAFSAAERAVVRRLRTPSAVQRWLNALPYNTEVGGETLHTFRGVVARGVVFATWNYPLVRDWVFSAPSRPALSPSASSEPVELEARAAARTR